MLPTEVLKKILSGPSTHPSNSEPLEGLEAFIVLALIASEPCYNEGMKECEATECNRPSRTRGLCSMHYSRFRRTGTVTDGRPWDKMTIEERFWAKVQKTETCWLWTGAIQPSGHGRFRDENKRTVSAYRWLWEHINGPVPDGLVLDHIVCDNPACVNPDHVTISTIGANVLRGQSESGKHARQTHCLRGHELSGDNLRTIVRPTRAGRTERVCIKCVQIRRNRAKPMGTES